MALLHKLLFFLAMLLLPLQMLLFPVMSASDCPLDLSESNFTLGASICSSKEDRGKCCRYINAIIAASVARYAAATGDLGVGSNSSEICLHSISETLDLYGVTRNATAFCGLGTKILVNYECMDLSTTNQMLQSPKFGDVMENCKPPLKADNDCRTCLNSGIIYLRNLIGAADNTTLSTCRDATFVALASQVDNASSIDIAGCFFGVQGLLTASVAGSSPLLPAPPQVSPSPYVAAGPSQLSLSTPIKENHRSYRLTLLPGVGIAVAAMASIMMAILSVLICMKRKELEDSDNNTKQERSTEFHQPAKKLQDGPSNMFRKFSYKETKNATRNFSVVIGEGGFGTVYKAEFDGTLVAAVKKMNKISEQAEDDFCKEIELLARLYHRHLVALRGFCIRKKDRFLIYEYMANGSLKDQLHGAGMALSWRTRIQIAIDVANALEYLHFYCNPPLCHRDIKSSNILLDENFIAKVADFGLAHASKDGSICFEPVNTDIKGTPGYMDPEYVVTQELTEKSDVYSYGVVLLELVTGRTVIQNNKNLVEWSQIYLTSEEESMITELVDSRIGESYDFDQLEAIVGIINWCTQKEGRARPSIKQVLRLLYECTDPVHSIFGEEDEDDFEGGKGRMSGGGRSRRSNGGGGDGRLLGSSSSTTRSYCSRSFLLETGSPTQSPINLPST